MTLAPLIVLIKQLKNNLKYIDNTLLMHYNRKRKEDMRMAKPKQNTQRLVVYISPELEKSLQREAEEKGTNVSNLIRMILTEREKTKDK